MSLDCKLRLISQLFFPSVCKISPRADSSLIAALISFFVSYWTRITERVAHQIMISSETDQVFKGVSGDFVIDDAGNSRKLTVNNLGGWADTVVWNPYGNEG